MIKKFISVFIVTALVILTFSACNTSLQEVATTVPATQTNPAETNMDFKFTDNDLDASFDENSATKIDVSNTKEITKAGTYILSGKLTNATFTVNAGKEDKIKLVFKNVSITNENGPAIYIKSADKVFITLAENTENIISDGKNYSVTDAETTIDSAIFSREDLTINGKGKLTVNGNFKHGIVSKDDLVITSGTINVTSKNTALYGKDCVKMTNTSVTAKAGTDAIKSDNAEDATRGFIYIESGNYNLTSENDGIQAVKAINIADGTFKISSGDDGIHSNDTFTFSKGTIDILKSYEGIEADHISISGGKISINASDDGLNATEPSDESTDKGPDKNMFTPTNSTINISGGYTYINSDGDGIDSNGSINISGGITLINGPSAAPEVGFDYNGNATVSGGILVSLSASGMIQNFSQATNQGSILYSFKDEQKAGTNFALCDENDKVIVSINSQKSYSAVLVTAPEIKEGKNYKIVTGAEIKNTDQYGYAASTEKTGGTVIETIQMTTSLYGASNGMPGGMTPDFGGGKPNGNFPNFDEMPSMPDGNIPQPPNGNIPDFGEMPSMPDGNFPQPPNGNIPGGPGGTPPQAQPGAKR